MHLTYFFWFVFDSSQHHNFSTAAAILSPSTPIRHHATAVRGSTRTRTSTWLKSQFRVFSSSLTGTHSTIQQKHLLILQTITKHQTHNHPNQIFSSQVTPTSSPSTIHPIPLPLPSSASSSSSSTKIQTLAENYGAPTRGASGSSSSPLRAKSSVLRIHGREKFKSTFTLLASPRTVGYEVGPHLVETKKEESCARS